MSMCNPEKGIGIETFVPLVHISNEVFADQQKVLESYSILSKAASLLEEKEAEDDRDDRLGQGEEEEGRLHSSAQPLL